MNKDIDKIIEVAKEVRECCERFAMSKESVDFDFHNVADLKCMCLVASYVLQKELVKKGIETELVGGRYADRFEYAYVDHCWLEWNNKVIDITATQFYGVSEKVIVLDAEEKEDAYFVMEKYIADKDFEDWGEEQRPTMELAEKIIYS